MGSGLIAFLHNEITPLPFGVFQIITAAALGLLLLFACKLPSKVWPCYVKKSDEMAKPSAFMAGLFLIIGLSTIMTLFGSVVAEDNDELVKPETVSAEAHAQARSPLLRTAPKTEHTAAPKQEPLHERRMKALMSRAPEPLTRREYQAADGIMRGLRRSEIAKEMQILPESVTKYTNRIYDKFGIHRRQDLFKLAETLDREWKGEEFRQ